MHFKTSSLTRETLMPSIDELLDQIAENIQTTKEPNGLPSVRDFIGAPIFSGEMADFIGESKLYKVRKAIVDQVFLGEDKLIHVEAYSTVQTEEKDWKAHVFSTVKLHYHGVGSLLFFLKERCLSLKDKLDGDEEITCVTQRQGFLTVITGEVGPFRTEAKGDRTFIYFQSSFPNVTVLLSLCPKQLKRLSDQLEYFYKNYKSLAGEVPAVFIGDSKERKLTSAQLLPDDLERTGYLMTPFYLEQCAKAGYYAMQSVLGIKSGLVQPIHLWEDETEQSAFLNAAEACLRNEPPNIIAKIMFGEDAEDAVAETCAFCISVQLIRMSPSLSKGTGLALVPVTKESAPKLLEFLNMDTTPEEFVEPVSILPARPVRSNLESNIRICVVCFK